MDAGAFTAIDLHFRDQKRFEHALPHARLASYSGRLCVGCRRERKSNDRAARNLNDSGLIHVKLGEMSGPRNEREGESGRPALKAVGRPALSARIDDESVKKAGRGNV